ncbi:MAG: right-handed parallel beta-helix repeat-containing protein [Opitutaceae bacterium]|nr:right-handed parallel beta-helix repeat-containing protein [Opitutaceae bacterium]
MAAFSTAFGGSLPETGAPRARDLYLDFQHEKPDHYKTIADAVARLRPGDTLHLPSPSTAGEVLRDVIVLQNKAGAPGAPIVIDGHGATLSGSVFLESADWEDLGDGLFRSEKWAVKISTTQSLLDRYFFIFDGRPEHMGRTSKGVHAPFKNPGDLLPGQWTYQAPPAPKTVTGGGAFFIRLAPGATVETARVEAPLHASGVAWSGTKSAHIIVKNLNVRHVWNDGFNLHGKSVDIRLENVTATECGDDGLSAHEECEVDVNGFVSRGNATGVCNIGASVCRMQNVSLEGNIAFEIYLYHSAFTRIQNGAIRATAERAIRLLGKDGATPPCRLELDAVTLVWRGGKPRLVEVMKKSVLVASRFSTSGLSWKVDADSEARLTHSVIAGPSANADGLSLSIHPGANWNAQDNLYAINRINVGEEHYARPDFARYQADTKQDSRSRWRDLTPVEQAQLGQCATGTARP